MRKLLINIVLLFVLVLILVFGTFIITYKILEYIISGFVLFLGDSISWIFVLLTYKSEEEFT